MDIVVKGRHTDVPERFRRHAAEKLSKIERLDHKVIRLDVEVSREHNPRLADSCDRVELTCHSRGPVIRAEAAAADAYAALDQAYEKLQNKLRRMADRRRVHHGRKSPVSVAAATSAAGVAEPVPGAAGVPGDLTGAPVPTSGVPGDEVAAGLLPPDAVGGVDGDGPMVVREKVHLAQPMSLDQALFEMELVGHDFFLFVDVDHGLPSVVYRRRGYDYGVIRVDTRVNGTRTG